MNKTLYTAIAAIAVFCIYSCKGNNPEPGPKPTPEDDEFALVDGGEVVASIEAVGCDRIARVIGITLPGETEPNPNKTWTRFGMASTDFGNMWDAGNGAVWAVFGDNFNNSGGDWLSNAIAVSTDKDMNDGLYYDSMLWDSKNNKRLEIIDSSGGEITCIPTGGFSVQTLVGRRQYVSYMSVKEWSVGGVPDQWTCNYSELVYSDDFGKTWTKSGVKWNGDSGFVQVAFVVQGDTVYMWGTPSGRLGQVRVARVAAKKVLDKSAWEYWDGALWVTDESRAVAVTNGTVSEMTVRYNTYFNRYMMMYVSANQRALVFRDAAAPEGDWSEEKIVLNNTYIYGPSIHPWFCDGKDLWYVASSVSREQGNSFDTWHIFLYHSKLHADPAGFNMVWESGFEYEPDRSLNYRTLWNIFDAITSHDAHSGSISVKLINNQAGVWKDGCTQVIPVRKNTRYRISGWMKSTVEGSNLSYLGVRIGDKIYDRNPALHTNSWTESSVEFNSGENTSLTVFFGTWGASGLSVLADDFVLSIVQ